MLTRKPSTMVAAFASRMACAPARLLLAAAVVCYSVEMVRSEAAHHGVGGSMIRVGTETPFALATEEKEFTSTLLHRWGLGSQRLFAELAGAMQRTIQPLSLQMAVSTIPTKASHDRLLLRELFSQDALSLMQASWIL